MSDTPITDREELCTTDYILPQFVVTSDICRELERENQQLKQTVLATLSQRGQKELIVAWDRVKELERENAALRAQDAWLVATFGNLEDENQKLRAELEAQAVVNGKGGEREAKLLAEVAALRSAMYRVRAAIDDPLGSQAQRLEKAADLCDEVLGKAEQP